MVKNSKYYANLLWFTYIPALFLFYAVNAGPDYDYMFLRYVVCGFAVAAVYNLYKAGNMGLASIPFFFAIVFNPFIPLHLQKQIWQILDVIGGIYFILQMPIAWKLASSAEKIENDSRADK